MSWLTALLNLLAHIANLIVGFRDKRDQEAADPVHKGEELQRDIEADNVSDIQDAFRHQDLVDRLNPDSDA